MLGRQLVHVGLVVTPTADPSGQGLLHLVHVGPAPTEVTLTRDGSPFLAGRSLTVPARGALTLPLGIALTGGVLEASTAELLGVEDGCVRLRGSQREDVVVLRTDREVTAPGSVSRDGELVTVTTAAGPGRTVEVVLAF